MSIFPPPTLRSTYEMNYKMEQKWMKFEWNEQQNEIDPMNDEI